MAYAARHTYTTRNKMTGERELRVIKSKWYAFFTDFTGRVKRIPGYKEYDQTVTLAHAMEKQHTDYRLGVGPPPAPIGRRRLKGDAPQLPGTAAAATLPELLAEFKAHMTRKGVSELHLKNVSPRLDKLFAALSRPEQITREHVERFLAEYRIVVNTKDGEVKTRRMSARTRWHYLRIAKQFTKWLADDREALRACPLRKIELPTRIRDADRVRVRRAEGADFLARLVASVRAKGRRVYKFPAEDRVWLYAMAAATGLRAKELSVLIPEDFRLAADPPHVTLPGRYTKNGDDLVLPIDRQTAAGLRAFLAGRPAGEPVWPGSWARHHCAGRVLGRDLDDAGLPRRDARGRTFDFHALRNTYVTAMGRTGAPLGVVQRAARHHDPKLTLNTYTDHRLHEIAAWADQMDLGSAFAPPTPNGAVSAANPHNDDSTQPENTDRPAFVEVDW